MHAMTAGNLRSAYGGESMAHLRYKIWGAKAAKDGYANVARLFGAISFAEQVHGTNHFKAMGAEAGAFLVASMAGFGLAETSDNLQGAVDGETFEINEMYPTYLETAKFQDEEAAQQSFHYALSAEKIHAVMFSDAKAAVDSGKDPDIGTIQICGVCGHTREGEAPATCPVCNSPKTVFKAFP